jgi:hypothetical protein
LLGHPRPSTASASLVIIDEDDELEHESIELDAAISFSSSSSSSSSGSGIVGQLVASQPAHPDELTALNSFRRSFDLSRRRRTRCVRVLAVLVTLLSLLLIFVAVAAQLNNLRASGALRDARPALDDLSLQLQVLDRLRHAKAQAREESTRIGEVMAALGPASGALPQLQLMQNSVNAFLSNASVCAKCKIWDEVAFALSTSRTQKSVTTTLSINE